MRHAVSFALALCISLWLGGLVALVMFVSSLFAFDRALAINAAPWLFHVFERYQIGLAAATTVLIVTWLALRRSRLKAAAALVLTLIADALAVLQIAWITPTINASRVADHARFDRFHHLSTNYFTITLLILATGVLFLLALRREARFIAAPDTAPTTAAA